VLVAETGGQNAMIADSSALPEQIVKDVIASAFQSAGQRCSAARVLYIQEDIADKVTGMLAGAMAELKVGDPGLLSTDVGPVIDEDAKAILVAHAERMDKEAKKIAEAPMDPAATAHGTFFAPRAYEIPSLSVLKREVFGPVLHLIRFKASELKNVVDEINSTGYGLTLGVHSRIDATVHYISQHARVGNCYVNRNQIGAVVGVQPFGGEGLSGTGPKAGGPHYLLRFAGERTLTINTTASGGNASLLTIGE
jgi:RHH-type proline utilization regulon transcriptional repressor/proline dehydrogenase/delta 1-pyrroline-5-carboxylate dehydrogenase